MAKGHEEREASRLTLLEFTSRVTYLHGIFPVCSLFPVRYLKNSSTAGLF